MSSGTYLYEVIGSIPCIFYEHGIRDVVMSPGSRNAPLTIAFARHGGFGLYVAGDERSAGFLALGMAQQSLRAVVLICTSGTAALNYAPAVNEAILQGIPLLLLTADRPPEWIGQGDGQTIRQNRIYFPNLNDTYELPADYTHPDQRWAVERIANQACHNVDIPPYQPVHINIPFREPLYPDAGDNTCVSADQGRYIKNYAVSPALDKSQWQEVIALLVRYPKKLIVAGQQAEDRQLIQCLQAFQQLNTIPLIPDVTANLFAVPGIIQHHDLILSKQDENALHALKPDLLISFGRNVLSKNLKQFFRNYKPVIHLHIEETGSLVDTFQSMTHCLPVPALVFFQELINRVKLTTDQAFCESWYQADRHAGRFIQTFFEQQHFGEFKALKIIKDKLPAGVMVQVANSMPVRYLNLLGVLPCSTYGNRGTSGIDGCVSTAVGAAVQSGKMTVLITGDMAFFYDRNGLWHQYVPDNFRVLLLNNHGGGIFRMLQGSSAQPELGEYFETTQPLSAKKTAEDFDMDYDFADHEDAFLKALGTFFKAGKRPKILEIKTDSHANSEIFNKFIKSFQNDNTG